MVTVYFETSSYCEQVATFENEAIYIKCLPTLEILAKKYNFEKVTEVIE